MQEQRSLSFQDVSFTTPLLVPSFSSKGLPNSKLIRNLKELVKLTEDYITDAVLISAYDVFSENIDVPIKFPELVVLDSGGYEAIKEMDFSDAEFFPYEPKPWNRYFYRMVLDNWPNNVPTIIVSYDDPYIRAPIQQQVAAAHQLFENYPDYLKTILIKPERHDIPYIDAASIIANIEAVADFHVLGVTEKELGSSVLARMRAISTIRRGLTDRGINIPIHVFGSLDTLSTILYFVSGADIFDGLSWLKYGYAEGLTRYVQEYGAKELGIERESDLVQLMMWARNTYYLQQMKIEMESFIQAGDFTCFLHHGEFIEKCYRSLSSA